MQLKQLKDEITDYRELRKESAKKSQKYIMSETSPGPTFYKLTQEEIQQEQELQKRWKAALLEMDLIMDECEDIINNQENLMIKETIDKVTEPTKFILSTMTEVKLNKKDKTRQIKNEFPPIFKMQKILVEVGSDYETKVNQKLTESNQTADFKSSGPKWGTSIDNKWLEHKEQLYLKCFEIEKVEHSQYYTATEDGLEPIEFEKFEPFFPTKSESKSETPDVKFRMYRLDSIIDIESV